jgi:hypothetical protein
MRKPRVAPAFWMATATTSPTSRSSRISPARERDARNSVSRSRSPDAVVDGADVRAVLATASAAAFGSAPHCR